jgi:hypothetical protein
MHGVIADNEEAAGSIPAAYGESQARSSMVEHRGVACKRSTSSPSKTLSAPPALATFNNVGAGRKCRVIGRRFDPGRVKRRQLHA